jgi:hypothetical protein
VIRFQVERVVNAMGVPVCFARVEPLRCNNEVKLAMSEAQRASIVPLFAGN